MPTTSHEFDASAPDAVVDEPQRTEGQYEYEYEIFPDLRWSPPAVGPQTKKKARTLLQHSARARLLETGPHALSDVEILSLVLRLAPRQCPQAKAAELLADMGSLRTIATAERNTLLAHGFNESSYVALHAGLELTRRHYHELMMCGPALGNPGATREYVRMKLRDRPHEVFACIYLNSRNRVIAYEELFRGTIDGSSVHPREVVKHALAHNCSSIILAHNHPSGGAEPSQADELITRRLKQALGLVDIRLVDHLIVADGVCTSFAERGLL